MPREDTGALVVENESIGYIKKIFYHWRSGIYWFLFV